MKILSNENYQAYEDCFEYFKREIEELKLIKQKYELIQEDLKKNGIEYKFVEHQSGRDIYGIWHYDVYITDKSLHLSEVLKDISENNDEDDDTINLNININLDGETVYKTLKEIRKGE